jgi:SAM-dependent methyltransferase
MHFLALPGGLKVHGCDIDGEAVEWCGQNLDSGEFSVIPPFPPTSYPDSSFDLIIGFSVFTHLTREAQGAWLSEMSRLIAPGGLFLASVHGESVTGDQVPERIQDLMRKGILDDAQDATLNGIAPDGYYRGVYQTHEYTLREYSRYFEVLDYIKRGVGNRQDLVVMRARSDSHNTKGERLGYDPSTRITSLELEIGDLRDSIARISAGIRELNRRDYKMPWKKRMKKYPRTLIGSLRRFSKK